MLNALPVTQATSAEGDHGDHVMGLAIPLA